MPSILDKSNTCSDVSVHQGAREGQMAAARPISTQASSTSVEDPPTRQSAPACRPARRPRRDQPPTNAPQRPAARQVRRYALLGDGVERAVTVVHLHHYWADLLDTLAREGSAPGINAIRAAEASDPDGRRYPRSRLNDDATHWYTESSDDPAIDTGASLRQVSLGPARQPVQPVSARSVSITSSGRQPLARNALAPAASAARSRAGPSKAENTSTLVPWPAAVMRPVASSPPTPGMRRSITTKSGASRAAMATPWSPSPASPTTVKPASSSRPRSAARMAGASSTTRIRGGAGPPCAEVLTCARA